MHPHFHSSELLERAAPLVTAVREPSEPQDLLLQNDLIMYFHLTIYSLIFKEAPSNTFLLDTQVELVGVVCEF